MRWTWNDRAQVLACADERRFADGEIVWSWHPDADVKVAGLD
jgi:hypothetical protein